MKKNVLHADYDRLGKAEIETLDVAAGTVVVWEAKKRTVYRLDEVYRQLVRRAYEMGRANVLPYR